MPTARPSTVPDELLAVTTTDQVHALAPDGPRDKAAALLADANRVRDPLERGRLSTQALELIRAQTVPLRTVRNVMSLHLHFTFGWKPVYCYRLAGLERPSWAHVRERAPEPVDMPTADEVPEDVAAELVELARDLYEQAWPVEEKLLELRQVARGTAFAQGITNMEIARAFGVEKGLVTKWREQWERNAGARPSRVR